MLPLRDYIRLAACRLRYFYQTRWLKMDIHPTALVSFGCHLDRVNPRGIHIGEESYIASGARILSHEYCLRLHADTRIGKRCFIGANALVLCGVTIGDNVIVGAGSVVTKNPPNNSIVAGNPATVIREGIKTTKYGQLLL